MCEPTTLMALSIATSAASAGAAHQQAAGQAKIQTAMHKINQRNSITAMGQEQYDINNREMQEREAMAQQVNETNRQALMQSASALVRVSETGLAGISMSNIMRDVSTQAAMKTSNIKTNMQWSSDNLATQRVGARNTAMGRMSSTTMGVGPSAIATGLKIGEAGLGAYSNYKSKK
jgi:hypothetical protein